MEFNKYWTHQDVVERYHLTWETFIGRKASKGHASKVGLLNKFRDQLEDNAVFYPCPGRRAYLFKPTEFDEFMQNIKSSDLRY